MRQVRMRLRSWNRAGIYLPKLAGCKRERGAEAIRGAHQECEPVHCPIDRQDWNVILTAAGTVTHHVRSVKVAKCKLLTMQRGVVC